MIVIPGTSKPVDSIVCYKSFGVRPGTEAPCPSLQEIVYTSSHPTHLYTEPFILLARKREGAGYWLGLVCVLATLQLDLGTLKKDERLRRYVGELQVSEVH